MIITKIITYNYTNSLFTINQKAFLCDYSEGMQHCILDMPKHLMLGFNKTTM